MNKNLFNALKRKRSVSGVTKELTAWKYEIIAGLSSDTYQLWFKPDDLIVVMIMECEIGQEIAEEEIEICDVLIIKNIIGNETFSTVVKMNEESLAVEKSGGIV